MKPTAEDFRKALREEFDYATNEGKPDVTLISGKIHRKVGGYPGQNHRMPLCCEVMRQLMRRGDVILEEPPSGKGATLKITYKLPY